jgi:hypothetical protein
MKEMKPIAPLWARILIAPAMIILMLGGLSLAAAGFYLSINQHLIDGIVPVAFGIFLVIVGWEGRWLYASRNVVACLKDNTLYYSYNINGNIRMISISDIEVVDLPWLKMAYLHQNSTGKRLISIDYWYKDGMSLFRAIQKKQKEQHLQEVSPTP